MTLLKLKFDAKVNDYVKSYSTLGFIGKRGQQTYDYSSAVTNSGIIAEKGQTLTQLFYRTPILSDNEPLHILDPVIFSRFYTYDLPRFSFEKNNKTEKLGSRAAGLFVKSKIRGTAITLYYANSNNSMEDAIFARAKRNFAHLQGSLSLLSVRGRQWEKANSSGWFNYWREDSNSWYSAYEFEQNYALNLNYLARLKRDNYVRPYLSYCYTTQNLDSIQWNQNGGANINRYRKWNLKQENKINFGVKSIIYPIKTEAQFNFVSTRLGQFYIDDYLTNKMSYFDWSLILSYKKRKMSGKLGVYNVLFKDFNEYYHYTYDDHLTPFYLDTYNYSDLFILGNTTGILKLYLNLFYNLRGINLFFDMRNYNYARAGESSAMTNESIFRAELPYFNYTLNMQVRNKYLNLSPDFKYSFINPYISFKFTPTNNFSLELGYGYDPEVFNDYTMDFSAGQPAALADYYNNVSDNNSSYRLYKAEEQMQNNRYVNVKAKIKF